MKKERAMKRLAAGLLICILCLLGATLAAGASAFDGYNVSVEAPRQVDISTEDTIDVSVSYGKADGEEAAEAYVRISLHAPKSDAVHDAVTVDLAKVEGSHKAAIDARALKELPPGEYSLTIDILDAEKNVLASSTDSIEAYASAPETPEPAPVETLEPAEEEIPVPKAPNGQRNAFTNVKVSMAVVYGDQMEMSITGDLETIDTARVIIEIKKFYDGYGAGVTVKEQTLKDLLTGPFVWSWNMIYNDGEKLEKMKYSVNVKARAYSNGSAGDYFFSQAYRVTYGEVAELTDFTVDTEKTYHLELSGGPECSVTSDRKGTVSIEVYDAEEKLIRTITQDIRGKNPTKISWDYKTDAGNYISKPGKYKLVASITNDVAKGGNILTREINVKQRPDITIEVKGAASKVSADPWETIKFSIKTNQICDYTVRVLNAQAKEVLKATSKRGKTSTYELTAIGKSGGITAGDYTLKVTALNILGKTKSATAKFTCTKPKAVTISDAKLSKTSVYAGDSITFSYKTSTLSFVRVDVFDSAGSLLGKGTEILSLKGSNSTSISTSGMSAGSYIARVTAWTGAGSVTAKKSFTIKKPPVSKMSISSVNVSYLGGATDSFTFSTRYSGAGTLYLSVVNSRGETVYSASKKVTSSGTWNHDMEGSKLTWLKKYTVKVYGNNSAGSSKTVSRSFEYTY